MNKWGEVLRDPDIKFPGESREYRRARNQLLESEDELRRLNELVSAQRRALPARQTPTGSAPGHGNEAGAIYGCCPRGTIPTTATGSTTGGQAS